MQRRRSACHHASEAPNAACFHSTCCSPTRSSHLRTASCEEQSLQVRRNTSHCPCTLAFSFSMVSNRLSSKPKRMAITTRGILYKNQIHCTKPRNGQNTPFRNWFKGCLHQPRQRTSWSCLSTSQRRSTCPIYLLPTQVTNQKNNVVSPSG